MMTIWINDDNLNELCQFEWTLVIRMNYDDLNEWGFQNDFFCAKEGGVKREWIYSQMGTTCYSYK